MVSFHELANNHQPIESINSLERNLFSNACFLLFAEPSLRHAFSWWSISQKLHVCCMNRWQFKWGLYAMVTLLPLQQLSLGKTERMFFHGRISLKTRSTSNCSRFWCQRSQNNVLDSINHVGRRRKELFFPSTRTCKNLHAWIKFIRNLWNKIQSSRNFLSRHSEWVDVSVAPANGCFWILLIRHDINKTFESGASAAKDDWLRKRKRILGP